MTQTYSQKRYRHHHDNAAPRFRDVPPRFKRQKSSSKSDTEENSENCENHIENAQPPSYSQGLLNQGYTSTQQTMKKPVKMINSQLRPSQGPALNDSPLSVDTRLYNQIPMGIPYSGPEYLCQQNFHTPPLSPWGVLNQGQMAVYPQVPNASVYSQNMRSSPAAQAVSPSLEMAKVNGDWKEQGRLSPDSQLAANSSTHSNLKQAVDHSDQDIRTIKILRELERVADLKEKEDQEKESAESLDNNKRQNHVSHHLRMLMCAVDRYTEDIDEDNSPFSENVSSSRSPAMMQQTPNMTNDWKVKQSKKQRPSKGEQFVTQDVKSSNGNTGKSNTKWVSDYPRQVQQFSNQQWSKTNGAQQLAYSKTWNASQLPVSQAQPLPLMPGTTPQNKMASPPPLMHHMLTPPPSRVSSPHPSHSLQYAPPMAPHVIYQPAAMSLQSPQVAMALQTPQPAMNRQSPPAAVTMPSQPVQAQRPRSQPLPQQAAMTPVTAKQIPRAEASPQDSLAHILSTPQSPLMAPGGFQPEMKGWDIWSSPDFFPNAEPNMDDFVSKARLPLYKR